MIPTDIDALYTVVMQGIACQSLFGKDFGLFDNPNAQDLLLPT